MKHLPALALAILVALSPKAEAQLNGEYSLNIAYIFETSPYTFGDYTHEDVDMPFAFYDSTPNLMIPIESGTSIHNPKNGSFTIRGVAKFYIPSDGGYYGELNTTPGQFNPALENDSWSLTDPRITISGKTYTDRKTKKSLLDTAGTITLKGTYTSAGKPESNINKGSLTFRASKLDCNRLYRDTNDEGYPAIRITGSASLANKQTKKFNVTDTTLEALYWGGDYYYREYTYGTVTTTISEGFYMDLNVNTSGSNITGTAKAYYFGSLTDNDPSVADDYIQYPDPETPAKEFTYSVKGTSRNGIAILNLTGLGVIKGLKATLHINEETEEIVQNGKNSITLYGQTITY